MDAPAKPGRRPRTIRCYLCGRISEVSHKTMSTTCPGCNRAIKVEDIVVKSYLPVNDLLTCGRIRITKRGRVAAKRIQSGDGIECEGAMEGFVETEGAVELGPKASWRGRAMHCGVLTVADGAKIEGLLIVPWQRPGE
jgi:cytoskeletal protein CcmA (bactofilin family)